MTLFRVQFKPDVLKDFNPELFLKYSSPSALKQGDNKNNNNKDSKDEDQSKLLSNESLEHWYLKLQTLFKIALTFLLVLQGV